MAQVRARRAAASSTAAKNDTEAQAAQETAVEVDCPNSGTPSSNGPKKKQTVSRPSLGKPKRPEYDLDVARKKSSTHGEEDSDHAIDCSDSEAPSSNRPKKKQTVSRPSLGKPKRPEKKSSTCGEEDIDLYEARSRKKAKDKEAIPRPSRAIQVDDNATDGGAAMQDLLPDSPLSQLSNVDDETTVVAQGSPVIPAKRRVNLKLPIPLSATNDDDGTAPPPQKKAKKVSTKPQTAPSKRNPARGKRANGF